MVNQLKQINADENERVLHITEAKRITSLFNIKAYIE